MRTSWTHTLVPGLVGLLAGVLLTSRFPVTAQPPGDETPRAPATFRPEAPALRGLDANLYMQTAAEYRACCLQAYNLAALRLKERLAERKDGDGKPAVVLDLDETILDNGGFQAMSLRSNLAFDIRLWDVWEEKQGELVALVPGARDFIHAAEKLGATIFYISNRNDQSRQATQKLLERLQIAVKQEKQLKLRTTTTDKTARRQAVEAEYAVLLYLGDNLRDFDEQFKCNVDNTGAKKTTDPAKLAAAIRERNDKVDRTRDKWGREWVILPNPAYGEWMKPLGLGRADLDRLAPAKKAN